MQIQDFITRIKKIILAGALATAGISVSDCAGISKEGPDITFKVLLDSTWKVPARGKETSIYLALEITNSGDDSIRFPIMDKISISMHGSKDDKIKTEGGQDVVIPGKPVTDPVPPGGKFLYQLPARLVWHDDDKLQLSIEDTYGSIWFFGPLKEGMYEFGLNYENIKNEKKDTSNIWFGRANINPVTIHIKN